MSERDRTIAKTELQHAELLADLIFRAAAEMTLGRKLVQSSVGALARRIRALVARPARS